VEQDIFGLFPSYYSFYSMDEISETIGNSEKRIREVITSPVFLLYVIIILQIFILVKK
jgi:hypothetical protein